MDRKKLAKTDLSVSRLGMGCMGMSEFYGPVNDADSLATLQTAYEFGINFFDTADIYGMGHNEELLAKFITDKRKKIVLATKCGIVRKQNDPHFRGLNGSYQYIKNACEQSLKLLKTEVIDLFYLHRIDPNVIIEESMEAMRDLKKEGKIRAVGLSEVNEDTIRRAEKVVPISALQSEFSLWTRSPEKKLIPLCQELEITFVPYSPLGRGFLTGTIKKNQLRNDDYRNSSPRFQGENFDKNYAVITQLNSIAQKRCCTLAQLSLAWMLNKHKEIVPIPGTKKIHYLKENIGSASINLSSEELEAIETCVNIDVIQGHRYPTEIMKSYNME